MIKKLMENWFNLVGIGIGLIISDTINIIRFALYLNFDLRNGDAEQMAIQMVHYMNTSKDPLALYLQISKIAGDIGIGLLLLGAVLYLVKREQTRGLLRIPVR